MDGLTVPTLTGEYVLTSEDCTSSVACLRETLRLYKESFTVTDSLGTRVIIPRGCDIFSNIWLVHRDAAQPSTTLAS